MNQPRYDWRRFWVRREDHLIVEGGGYLQDPDHPYGALSNPYAVPFERIASSPCLVLLGEPGIGKSSALKEVHDTLVSGNVSGHIILFKDLKAYGSDSLLVREVFESKEVADWKNSSSTLHLILDSLDECLLRVDSVASLLSQKLWELGPESSARLRLTIACRTAVWPGLLEKRLIELWGEPNVGVYELAPLRRRDVAEAATREGLDPDRFLSEIDHRNVGPLAAKPITLRFLINRFRRDGSLPPDQATLYADGCRVLCEEPSESRQSAQRLGTLTADQRLAIASRIAACTILGNRAGVWIGRDLGDVPQDYLTGRDMAGSTETVAGGHFEVTEAGVREVLDTALFTSRGPERMGWAHQTYAEFLAARYCVFHEMAPRQLLSLLVHPEDSDGGVVLQLSEVAAWLATLSPQLVPAICQRSPEILLMSDAGALDYQSREEITAALLSRFESDKLRDWFGMASQFHKLLHPRLADQLRAKLNHSVPVRAREVAVHIAAACDLTALQDELVTIACSPKENEYLRVSAALAVGRVGDRDAKLALRQIVAGATPGDAGDELKGAALKALWPEHLRLDELLALMTPPSGNVIGVYWMFLVADFAQGLAVEDLPSALDWLADQTKGVLRHMRPYERAVDSIMAKAWDHVEAPGVPEALARVILARLEIGQEPLWGQHDSESGEDALKKDPRKRRRLVAALVTMLRMKQPEVVWRVGIGSPLTQGEDLGWMADQLRAASEDLKPIWAKLMRCAYDPREVQHLEVVYEASLSFSQVREEFRWLLDPVDLDSQQAADLRRWHQEQREREEQRRRPLLDPAPVERVRNLLDQFEQGDLEAWWMLNREMTLEADSTEYPFALELEADLTQLPGWRDASAQNRERICAAAMRYLEHYGPIPQDWIGTDTFYYSALAGFRALRLLWQVDSNTVQSLSTDLWERWSPCIVAAFCLMERESKESGNELFVLAYRNSPGEVLAALLKLVDSENAKHQQIFVLDSIPDIWDGRVAASLLDKAKDSRLAPQSLGRVLGELLRHREAPAADYAASLIRKRTAGQGPAYQRAIIAARELLLHWADRAWPLLWPLLRRRTRFAREVVTAVAGALHGQGGRLTAQLNEQRVAELYVVAAKLYPYDTDPRPQAPRQMMGMDYARELRDDLLRALRDRGTPASMDAIEWASRKLPERERLEWSLYAARRNILLKSWDPPHPSAILALAQSRQARYVQNGSQLLDILQESLGRLQTDLQGQLPAARFLWNQTSRTGLTPKGELDLSDWIARHLRTDLSERPIVVNREVQIRRGQHTDIYIDAISQRLGIPSANVSAILEVKGCWNAELMTAMRTQLASRYLKDNQTRHGMYVVGWFASPSWVGSQAQRCARRDPHALVSDLGEQARALSETAEIRVSVLDVSLTK